MRFVYKGYIGIARKMEDKTFHGEVQGIRDVVTFQSKTKKGLKKAFRDSVEDYLDFCQQRRELPNKGNN